MQKKKTRMLTIHESHDMIIREKEDRKRGDEKTKCKRERSRLKRNRFKQIPTPRSAAPQLCYDRPPLPVPCPHPPVHLHITPAHNIRQGNVIRCLYQIAHLAMCFVCVFPQEPVALGGALGVWAFVPQRRVWEVLRLHVSFDLFVGRARP